MIQGMDINQLRELVIKPVLSYLNPLIPYSDHAVELLLMTAAHETRLGKYIQQVRGPAEGVYQMEPNTAQDIIKNFLEHRKDLFCAVQGLQPRITVLPPLYSIAYATAMARVQYYRDKEPLPEGNLHDVQTIQALADYAKRVFNTPKGAANPGDYFQAYLELCT